MTEVTASAVPSGVGQYIAVELLDRLEAKTLIKRERDPEDRRRARIAMTRKGGELVRKLSDVHVEELRDSAPALVDALEGVLRTTPRGAA